MRPSIAVIGALALGSADLAAAPAAPPVLLWNTTASAPLGLWRLWPAATISVGDWLAIRPPPDLARALALRGALPTGVLLLKRAAALSPSIVCRQGAAVLIDGQDRAVALARDRWGRTLPQWRTCRRLRLGEVFLLNPAPGSLDSRYFGPLSTNAVVAQAKPLLTAGGPA